MRDGVATPPPSELLSLEMLHAPLLVRLSISARFLPIPIPLSRSGFLPAADVAPNSPAMGSEDWFRLGLLLLLANSRAWLEGGRPRPIGALGEPYDLRGPPKRELARREGEGIDGSGENSLASDSGESDMANGLLLVNLRGSDFRGAEVQLRVVSK